MRIVILNLFLLMLLALTSCTKWQHQYPEDTERSKLTPMERLAGKTWTLQQVTLNGIDYTDSVYNQIGVLQIMCETNPIESFTGNTFYFSKAFTSYEGYFNTVWSLSSDLNNLFYVRYNGSSNIFPLCILYKYYDSYSGFYKKAPVILKLSSEILKISISTENADSILINTFSSK